MPTPRLVKITAWSYSRFTDYEQCPFLAKCKIVDRLKEPDSPSGYKGTRTHALAAAYATRTLPVRDKDNVKFYDELVDMLRSKKIPVELETFAEEFKTVREIKSALAESEWAFNSNWEACGWFDSSAWLRVKVDLHWLSQERNGRLRKTVVHVRDHKTGREYAEHELQRELYGLGALLQYPDADEVVVEHWYLDGGKIGGPSVFKADDLPRLQAEWVRRTTAMLNDTSFAPRPSDKCRFCHFRKANNGPCKF